MVCAGHDGGVMQTLSLSAITNQALAAGELPTRLQFLGWGSNPSQVGPVVVSEVTLSALSEQIEQKVYDRILIDFEHSSEPGSPTYQKPPREHAGYGYLEVVPNVGVFLNGIVWTPAGKRYAREYCDLSPAVKMDKEGNVVRVKSLALCPNGAVHDLTFFSASDDNGGAKTMDWKKWLCGLLGKDEGIKDEDLQGAFTEHITQLCADAVKAFQEQVEPRVAQLEESLKLLSADDAKKGAEAVATLVGSVNDLSGKVTALEGQMAERDRADVVRQAAMEGKVIPLSAEQLAATPLETLKTMVEKLPVTVPVDRRTAANTETPGMEDETLLSAEDIEMGKKYGFSPEEMAAANGLKLQAAK